MFDLGINWQTATAGGLMTIVGYVFLEIFKLCVKMAKKRIKRRLKR